MRQLDGSGVFSLGMPSVETSVLGFEQDVANGKVFRVETPFPAEFGDPSSFVVLVWGYADGDRDDEERDILGFAFIREGD